MLDRDRTKLRTLRKLKRYVPPWHTRNISSLLLFSIPPIYTYVYTIRVIVSWLNQVQGQVGRSSKGSTINKEHRPIFCIARSSVLWLFGAQFVSEGKADSTSETKSTRGIATRQERDRDTVVAPRGRRKTRALELNMSAKRKATAIMQHHKVSRSRLPPYHHVIGLFSRQDSVKRVVDASI